MLSVQERLELYREERKHLDDPLFGPPFPTFGEWNKEYEADHKLNHVTVSVEEADEIMDAIVEQADTELQAPTIEIPQVPPNVVVADVALPIVGTQEPAIVPAKGKKVKKSDVARHIIKQNAGKPRAEVLPLLEAAGLTARAANTYFYKYK